MYPAYIVEIFDRHGKRLFIQKVGSFNTGGANTVEGNEFEGWNGKYNGHDMPSDDYWYLITVEEIRKQYTGHFTLKR
jgi:gliding motility-associated-like protein